MTLTLIAPLSDFLGSGLGGHSRGVILEFTPCVFGASLDVYLETYGHLCGIAQHVEHNTLKLGVLSDP